MVHVCDAKLVITTALATIHHPIRWDKMVNPCLFNPFKQIQIKFMQFMLIAFFAHGIIYQYWHLFFHCYSLAEQIIEKCFLCMVTISFL